MMKDFTSPILLLYILLISGCVYSQNYHHVQETGYHTPAVSYSRMIGPTSSQRLTMNSRGQMTLHPVPTHTTLWPAVLPAATIKHQQADTSWSRHQHPHHHYTTTTTTTTPSPWRIILPSNSYDHYHTPNNHVTVIHHHVIHRYHHRRPISTSVITSTLRPRPTSSTTSTTTTTMRPTTVSEATTTTTSTTTERSEISERRTTTSKEVNCSGERKRLEQIWRDEDENLSLSLERNFPLFNDY